MEPGRAVDPAVDDVDHLEERPVIAVVDSDVVEPGVNGAYGARASLGDQERAAVGQRGGCGDESPDDNGKKEHEPAHRFLLR